MPAPSPNAFALGQQSETDWPSEPVDSPAWAKVPEQNVLFVFKLNPPPPPRKRYKPGCVPSPPTLAITESAYQTYQISSFLFRFRARSRITTVRAVYLWYGEVDQSLPICFFLFFFLVSCVQTVIVWRSLLTPWSAEMEDKKRGT